MAESEGYDFEQLAPFQNHEYVRYEGELYRIRLRKGELYASYSIEASVGSPSDDDTVIAFDSLPEDIQDEVRTAIREGNGRDVAVAVYLDSTKFFIYLI